MATRKSVPFLAATLLAILVAFPAIILWLPQSM